MRTELVFLLKLVVAMVTERKPPGDLKVVRVDSSELSSLGLKCLFCPRLFPRRSNWVQHLNYAHRIRIGKVAKGWKFIVSE